MDSLRGLGRYLTQLAIYCCVLLLAIGRRLRQRLSEYLKQERPVEAIQPEHSLDASVGVTATSASEDGSLVIGHAYIKGKLVPPVKSPDPSFEKSPHSASKCVGTQPSTQEQCAPEITASENNTAIHRDNTTSAPIYGGCDSKDSDVCDESVQLSGCVSGGSEDEHNSGTEHTTDSHPTECSHDNDKSSEKTKVSSTVQSFLDSQFKGEVPPGSTLLEEVKAVIEVQNVGSVSMVESVGDKGLSLIVTKSGSYDGSKGSSTDHVLVNEINEMNNRGDVDSKALQDKVKQKQQIVESQELLREHRPLSDLTAGSDPSLDAGTDPLSYGAGMDPAGTDSPLGSTGMDPVGTDPLSDTGMDPAGTDSPSDTGMDPAGTDSPSDTGTDPEIDPRLNGGSNPSSNSENTSSNTEQNTSSDADADASSSGTDSSDQHVVRRNRSKTLRSNKSRECPLDSDISQLQRTATSEVVNSKDTLCPNSIGQSTGRGGVRRRRRRSRKPSEPAVSGPASTEESGGAHTTDDVEPTVNPGSEPAKQKPQNHSQPSRQQLEQTSVPPNRRTRPRSGVSASERRTLFGSVPVQETDPNGSSVMTYPRPSLLYISQEHSVFLPPFEECPMQSLQPVVESFSQHCYPATGEVIILDEEQETRPAHPFFSRPVYLPHGELCLHRGAGVQSESFRWFVVSVLRGQCDAGCVLRDAMAMWIAAGCPRQMRQLLVALLRYLRQENRSLLDLHSIRVLRESVLAVPVSAVSLGSTVWSQLNTLRILAQVVEEFLGRWDTSQQRGSLADIMPLRQFLGWIRRLEGGVEIVGGCPLEDALLQLGEKSTRQRLFVETDVTSDREDE